MSISFNQIPAGLRIPFAAIEFDSSRAQQGPADLQYKGLLIGQRISGGSGSANMLYRVRSPGDVIGLAGRGSLAHRMARSWFANGGQYTETWLGLLDDDGAGVAAEGSAVVGGTATAPGSIVFYVGRDRIPVAVSAGDASTAIATALAAAINAAADLPVTATVASSTVTLAARGAGTYGNEIDLRHSYNDGEALPGGVSLTITPMASGANNPDLTDLIAAMGDVWYNIIAMPYKDATSLSTFETEMASRFGPMRRIDGVGFAASTETFANLNTLGNSRNSPHVSIAGDDGDPTPGYELAAGIAANAALYGRGSDAARGFEGLPIAGSVAPPENALLTNSERNILLNNGISTLRKSAGGGVEIERLITTYKTNSVGSPDIAYLDVSTMLTLMYLRYTWRVRMSKFQRYKLASDGTRFDTGQKVMTPLLGKAEAVAWFADMERLGLVENVEQFKRDLIVERDKSNVNQMNFLLPPDLVNPLFVIAAQIQFLL